MPGIRLSQEGAVGLSSGHVLLDGLALRWSNIETMAKNNNQSQRFSPPPSKAERQAKFLRECEEMGLSAQEGMKRASVFPDVPADKIKILHCPKF